MRKYYFNAIMAIIAVVSFLFAVFVYYETRPNREVSYSINESEIANDFDISGFCFSNEIVEFCDGFRYTSIDMWNSGSMPIDIDYVRMPITINMGSNENHYAVITDSNVPVNNFRIRYSENLNSYVIDFDRFDVGAAFRVSILHDQVLSPHFVLSEFPDEGGNLVGLMRRDFLPNSGIEPPSNAIFDSFKIIATGMMLAVMLGAAFSVSFVLLETIFAKMNINTSGEQFKKYSRYTLLIILSGPILFIVVMLYYRFIVYSPSPI